MSNLFAKREKKELSPAQQKAKTIVGWVVSILCVIIIIGALAISVLTITRSTSEDNVAHLGKYTFNSVVTDSMEPTIEQGELIIAEMYDDETDRDSLQVGLTIVYKDLVYDSSAGGNITVYKVHRIVSIGSSSCHVIGDNPNTTDREDNVAYSNIIATWGSPATLNEDGTFTVTKDTEGSSLGKLGVFVNWLQQDRTNYFCVIVLPLILLFVVYGFILIRSLVIARITKENADKKVSVDELSEEEKKRLAEELLASLNKPETAEETVVTEQGAEETVEETKNIFDDENIDGEESGQ